MKSKKLKLDMYYDEGYWFVDNKLLNIIGFGKTPEEALKDFSLRLLYFRKYYTKISDDKLMGQATKLKKIFLKYFGEIK